MDQMERFDVTPNIKTFAALFSAYCLGSAFDKACVVPSQARHACKAPAHASSLVCERQV